MFYLNSLLYQLNLKRNLCLIFFKYNTNKIKQKLIKKKKGKNIFFQV